MYYIKTIPGMGRSLFTLNSDIKKDKIIGEFEILVLDEFDTVLCNNTALRYYFFKYNDKQDCLVLGDGEIFNHSDIPNVGYRLIDLENRKVMQFYALSDIMPHTQLFIDYSADTKVNLMEYKHQKSLY